MNIKNLPPNKNSKYTQGYYTNAKKYFGPEPIIYRSSLEYDFIILLESNPKVLKWSSEQIKIPYTLKEKIKGKFVTVRHNYNTDFTVITEKVKYIIEIKPEALTPLNEAQIHRNPVMYKNACKWKAAIAWAKLNGYVFKVINEKHLKTKIFL